MPLDVASITDATSAERFEAWLEITCTSLARQVLTQSAPRNRAQTPKAKKDAQLAETELERVRTGKLFFPFLPRSRAAGLRVVGGTEWCVDQAVFDRQDFAHGQG